MKQATVPALRDYWLAVVDYGNGLLDRLPLQAEPQPLDATLHKLAPLLQAMEGEEVVVLSALNKPPALPPQENVMGVGLNSVGMLCDRLSILIIKEWCLCNKGAHSQAKAGALRREQTLDIVEALCQARPGNSAMNTKITSQPVEATAHSWPQAFYKLLGTNLLLWEAQEVLYIRDIGALPCEELRAYIAYFSSGNLRRNEFMQKCEEFYWSDSS